MACNAARSVETLARVLRDAGVSQRTAGAAIGHSDAYVNRRLTGDVPLSVEDLERLALVAGYDVRIELVPMDPQGVH